MLPVGFEPRLQILNSFGLPFEQSLLPLSEMILVASEWTDLFHDRVQKGWLFSEWDSFNLWLPETEKASHLWIWTLDTESNFKVSFRLERRKTCNRDHLQSLFSLLSSVSTPLPRLTTTWRSSLKSFLTGCFAFKSCNLMWLRFGRPTKYYCWIIKPTEDPSRAF